MRLGNLGLGLTFPQGGGAPAVDYAAEVEAFLSGTTGCVFDFTDTARMWEESTKTTPVADIADPIGAIETKYGTTTYTFAEVAPNLGAWTGSACEFDGADDRLIASAAYGVLNNVPAVTLIQRIRFDALTTNPVIMAIGTNTNQNPRFVCEVITDGTLRLQIRRLDGDTVNILSSAAGVISTGTGYTIRSEVDYAGAGTAKAWVNGSLVIDTTITGTPANTSATNSNRWRLSLALLNGTFQFLNGAISRAIIAPKLLSGAETTSGIGYVEEAAV